MCHGSVIDNQRYLIIRQKLVLHEQSKNLVIPITLQYISDAFNMLTDFF